MKYNDKGQRLTRSVKTMICKKCGYNILSGEDKVYKEFYSFPMKHMYRIAYHECCIEKSYKTP